jgi:hypothetical protein
MLAVLDKVGDPPSPMHTLDECIAWAAAQRGHVGRLNLVKPSHDGRKSSTPAPAAAAASTAATAAAAAGKLSA